MNGNGNDNGNDIGNDNETDSGAGRQLRLGPCTAYIPWDDGGQTSLAP